MKVLATRPITTGAFRTYKAEDLTDEWLWDRPDEAFREPFAVESPEGLGMRMPRGNLPIEEIARIVGEDTPLEVIDCAAQSSLANWTLGQWAAYYNNPRRDKIRNVISLEVTESPLREEVVPPEIVRKLDWVDQFWPRDQRGPGEYPTVMRYCLMSVKDCFTEWHCDFAASSVFYHVLRGGKTFYFIRPTPANLAAYEKWSGDKDLQENTWLGDMVDEVYQIALKPGNTMIIPTGWIHAVHTPADSLVFGGNFLHSLEIDIQLAVYQIELNTKVPKKFRFPHFVRLLWMVGNGYLERLRAIGPEEELPRDMSTRVLNGLRRLAEFLIDQAARFAKGTQANEARRKIARDNVPWDIVPDPASTARELRRAVLTRLGEPWDELCYSPSELATVKREEQSASPAAAKKAVNGSATGNKRRASTATVDDSPAARKPAPARTTTKIKPARKPSTPGPTRLPAPSQDFQGEIISHESTPLATSTSIAPRADPLDPHAIEHPAEVRVGTQTNEVTRRRVEWSEEEGIEVVWVERRTQVVTVERVRWPPSEAALREQREGEQKEASELASQYFARGAGQTAQGGKTEGTGGGAEGAVAVAEEEPGSLPSPAPSGGAGGGGPQDSLPSISNLLNGEQSMVVEP